MFRSKLSSTSPSPTHTHSRSYLLQTPLAMTQTQSNVPNTFNPFIVHGFTNNNAVEHNQPPPQPSKYPRPIPSSATQYLAGTPAHLQNHPRQPSSNNNIIHSPEPRRPITLAKSQQSANQRRREPVFVPFHQDRSSPELEEILLRKKLAKTLSHVALGP
jgi:protein N-terminal glutamine amidohydrolase